MWSSCEATGARNARGRYICWCVVLCASSVSSARAAAYEEFETVVRTSSAKASLDDAASSSVITRERTAQSGASLPSLLAEVPSAKVTRTGSQGALATVSLRGSTANQVLVYLDGVPLNTIIGGGVDMSSFSLYDLDRIEIYRGMSPVAFGASAIGGVIAITTRIPEETMAEAELDLGAFGTQGASVRGAYVRDRLRLHVAGHRLSSIGAFPYANDGGTAFDVSDDRVVLRRNNDRVQRGGSMRASFDLDARRTLRASISRFEHEQGLAGLGLYPTTASRSDSARTIASLTYLGRDELLEGDELLALVYGLHARARLDDPLAEIGPYAQKTNDVSRAAGATLRLEEPVLTWLRLKSVADGRGEGYAPRDLSTTSQKAPQATRTFAALGLELTAESSEARYSLSPSARLEWSRDEVLGRGVFGEMRDAGPPLERTLPILRLAARAAPLEALVLRANIGRYARLPAATELYGNGGLVLGNLELLPESGVNADLGAKLEGRWRRLRGDLDVSLFGSEVRELITFVRNNTGTVRAQNLGHARILGVESAARVTFAERARLSSQVTFTDARAQDAARASHGRQLPLRPRLRTFARAECLPLALGQSLVVGAYADLDLTSGTYADPANLVRFGARYLFGAGAHIGTREGDLRLVVSGHNLTNSAVNDMIGYPLPGRAVFLTLSVKATHRGDDNS